MKNDLGIMNIRDLDESLAALLGDLMEIDERLDRIESILGIMKQKYAPLCSRCGFYHLSELC